MRALLEAKRFGDVFHPHLPRPSHLLLRDWKVLAGLLVAVATLALAALVANGSLLALDEPVSEWARSQEWLGSIAWVNQFGSEAQGMVLALLLGAVLWRYCRRFALVLPATVAFGIVLNVSMKLLVGRPRPPAPEASVSLASFPSGHALHAVILFGLVPPAVYLLTRNRALFWLSAALGGAMALSVAITRVHLGAHWPTDVAASMLIGAAVLLLGEVLVARPHAEGRPCALHRCADAPELAKLPA